MTSELARLPATEAIAAMLYEAANPTMRWSYLWPSHNHLHAAVRQRYMEAAARFEDMAEPSLAALSPAPVADQNVDCERCQGNGEVVTDWDRYLHAHKGDVGDEAVADCPDCDGIGKVTSPAPGDAEAMVKATDALIKAGDRLSFQAQTSGGVAGRDEGLVSAIDEWGKRRDALKAMRRIQRFEPSPAPEAEKMREAGWLIEWPAEGDKYPLRWAKANGEYTLDANNAVRFARKQDAMDMIKAQKLGGFAKAVEHMWLPTRAALKEEKAS